MSSDVATSADISISSVEHRRADRNAARDIIDRARVAGRGWGARSVSQRCSAMMPLIGEIAERVDEIADLLCAENGKPRSEAVTHEVVAAVQLVRHHCRTAPEILRERRVSMPIQPHRSARIKRMPFGVALAIAPWNLPFIIPLSQVLAPLLAGNAVILKPSELTPRSGALIGDLISACNLPTDVFQVIQGDGAIAAGLIDARPDKVLFTGSVATGRKVMAACAKFPIPVSLELGGVDAMIVREDADLEFTAAAATWGATFNGGQACCSVERLIVHRSLYDRLVARIADKMARIDRRRELAPAIDQRQADTWRRHLADARQRELAVTAGGQFSSELRLEPTLITGADIGESAVWNEETFGPVVAAVPFDTDDEAIELHNATHFGLTASVFSRDLNAARAMADQLRVGLVSINDVAATAYSSPELPWGGIGESGFGRTHGEEGLIDSTWAKVIESPRIPMNAKRPWWYPYGRDLEQAMTALAQALASDGPTRARRLAKAGAGVLPLLSRNPRL